MAVGIEELSPANHRVDSEERAVLVYLVPDLFPLQFFSESKEAIAHVKLNKDPRSGFDKNDCSWERLAFVHMKVGCARDQRSPTRELASPKVPRHLPHYADWPMLDV
jgi:hypothetical protein